MSYLLRPKRTAHRDAVEGALVTLLELPPMIKRTGLGIVGEHIAIHPMHVRRQDESAKFETIVREKVANIGKRAALFLHVKC